MTDRAADHFKDTALSPLPAEWEVATLGDLAVEFFSGGTPSTKGPQFWDGEIPWTTSAYLEGLYLDRGAKYITRQGLEKSSARLVPRGNLLIGTRVGVGKVAINSIDIAISQDLTGAIVDRTKAHPEFLAYAIQFDGVQESIRLATRGTTIKGIPRKDLVQILIPLPPLPEQRRIAHVLNTIQRAIAAQQDVIAAARELKRSLMQRLFTYGPVTQRRGGAEAPRVELKETEIGPIPAHWEIMPLEKYALVQIGAAKGRKLDDRDTITVPYLRVANVQDGYLDLSEIKEIRIRESELGRYSLQPGDVVLTEGGDFDKLGRGFIWHGEVPNCVHQNHIFAVRADRDRLLPEYLAYLVQSDYGKSYFLKVAHRTTHLACINKTKLKAFPLLVPPLSEQERIARFLHVADGKIAAEEQRLAALQALFRSLLQQLMTGQVRV